MGASGVRATERRRVHRRREQDRPPPPPGRVARPAMACRRKTSHIPRVWAVGARYCRGALASRRVDRVNRENWSPQDGSCPRNRDGRTLQPLDPWSQQATPAVGEPGARRRRRGAGAADSYKCVCAKSRPRWCVGGGHSIQGQFVEGLDEIKLIPPVGKTHAAIRVQNRRWAPVNPRARCSGKSFPTPEASPPHPLSADARPVELVAPVRQPLAQFASRSPKKPSMSRAAAAPIDCGCSFRIQTARWIDRRPLLMSEISSRSTPPPNRLRLKEHGLGLGPRRAFDSSHEPQHVQEAARPVQRRQCECCCRPPHRSGPRGAWGAIVGRTLGICLAEGVRLVARTRISTYVRARC